MPSIPSAGVAPAASFELAGLVPQLPPTPILAEPINARSREVESINEGVSVAQGMVGYLVGLQRGSGAAIRSFGQRFRELSHVDSESSETVNSMVREALKPATDSGVLLIDSIAVAVEPGDSTQIEGRITYRDLAEPRADQDKALTIEDS